MPNAHRDGSTHGNNNRGLTAGAIPGVAFGRYGAMFEELASAQRLPVGALWALAEAMIKVDQGAPLAGEDPADENPTIPAGYTYFGQFIDHDLTLDPTPFNAAERDRSALVDFRSPALDLDNMYGRGPDDQPYMYDAAGLKLILGKAPGNQGAEVGTLNDLFRIPGGLADGVRPDAPIIGDKRNDENKIVSQIHTAMIHFHNKVVGDEALIKLFGGNADDNTSRFKAAANIVRWHYQWVVVFDYLDRICEPGMMAEVLNSSGTPKLIHYLKTDATYPYMPVEFAGAAFRFGHSMVRPSYALNKEIGAQLPDPDPNALSRVPTFNRADDPTLNLNGFPGPLSDGWGIDWGFFVDVPTAKLTDEQADPANANHFRVPQPSYRIDALLVSPLIDLPEFFGSTDPPELVAQIGEAKIELPPGLPKGNHLPIKQTITGHLAFRNLLRGQELGLPSGQDVARALGIVPLTDEIIWSAGSRLLDVAKLNDGDKAAFQATVTARKKMFADWSAQGLAGSTPLWFYILREAEYYGVTHDLNEPMVGMGGQHLGPVGSRIVAETLIGVLWLDKTSFLHDPRGFQPLHEITGGKEMTLATLLTYALT